jgi:archaellum biogenesis ATPase FlaH
MMFKEGKPGICITRKGAKVLKEKYGLENFTLIRLGKKESTQGMLSSALGITESSISSANLSSLYERIVEHLSQNEGAVLLLDGIEYLLSLNEFRSVMKFVQKLNDVLEKYKAYLLITISPNSLKPTEMSTLEREMTEVINID